MTVPPLASPVGCLNIATTSVFLETKDDVITNELGCGRITRRPSS